MAALLLAHFLAVGFAVLLGAYMKQLSVFASIPRGRSRAIPPTGSHRGMLNVAHLLTLVRRVGPRSVVSF